MTIELPRDIENLLIAKVHSGLFPSMDAAMTEAARLLLEQIERDQAKPQSPTSGQDAADATPDPLMGLWQDYAEEMDEIVADAMKRRKEEPWRVIPGE
jgi:Arc/MetJ-type ribon-helix-helix transcriptional regulator